MKKLLLLLLPLCVYGAGSTASSYTASGTAGTGFLQVATQSSAPSTPTTAIRLYANSTNDLAWKEAGGLVGVVDLGGASRTITLSGSPTLGDWFDQAVKAASSPSFNRVTSTVATGTSPLVVASTTVVANLNASLLGGATFAAPGAIGGGTPGTGAFTTVSGTTWTGTGLNTSQYFQSKRNGDNTVATGYQYVISDAGGTIKSAIGMNAAEDMVISRSGTQVAAVTATGVAVTGVITSTGNVSVGSATGAPFMRSATFSEGGPAYSYAGDDDTGVWRSTADTLQLVTGGSARVTITSTGVAVAGKLAPSKDATSTPTMTVDDSSAGATGHKVLYWTRGGVEVGSISVTDTNTTYTTVSDGRLKTNVRDFTDSGRLIDALRPRVYDWKTGGKDEIGLIAQEINFVDPVLARIGAVTVGDDGDDITYKWGRSDQALVPILIAELKSLRARVAALEMK